MTVREIAKLAGVSPATVSRYFTGAENVSRDNCRKIEAVLGEDAAVLAAQKRRSGPVVLAVPHMKLEYYKELMNLFTELAPERGMQSVFIPTYRLSEAEFRTKLARLRPAGLVLLDEQSEFSLKAVAESMKIPVMLCGELSLYSRELTAVHVNDALAAYEGTKYLLSLGHRKIVFFSNHGKGVDASHQRLSGCSRAMNEAGLEFGEPYVQYAPLRYESGYSLASKIIREKLDFSAIFAFSDEMAHGAVNALIDAGYRVPEDISVMGFDDLPLAEEMRPKLTTIHQPLEQFVYEILNYFSFPVAQEKGREIMLKHSLIERESCKAYTENK